MTVRAPYDQDDSQAGAFAPPKVSVGRSSFGKLLPGPARGLGPQTTSVARSQKCVATCADDLATAAAQGDGVPPAEAREFCDWLHSEAPGGMAGVCFSVLALGDR